MCDPAVWRSQCAEALASTSARLSQSGPRAQALGRQREDLLEHQVLRIVNSASGDRYIR